MRLLVGLGNPGEEHSRNRHNIGFMAVDEIVRRHSFSPWRARFKGKVAEGVVAGERAVALKPSTYMNLSGEAVSEAARYLRIMNSDIFVFHDELDLIPGRMRVKQGGGAAGHNGLRSIDAHCGNDTWRIRMGIGHPGNRDLVLHWVLGDFVKSDRLWLEPLLDAVAVELPLLLAKDANAFMSRVAQAQPQPPAPPSISQPPVGNA